MRLHRSLAAALTSFGVLTLPLIVGAAPRAESPRALDPNTLSLRLLLGVGDPQTQTWGGRVKLDQGEVLGIEGWRFRAGDRVTGVDSWEARSRLIRKAAAKKAAAAKNAAAPQAKTTGPSTTGPAVAPNGVIVSLKAPPEATLAVETEHGRFDVRVADLADGSPRRYLDGQVEAQRMPPGAPLVAGPEHEDFPAAAADAHGAAWVAYVVHTPRGPDVLESYRERPRSFAHLVPEGGGDQVRLLRFADGRPGEPIDVTPPGRDVWRPAVAVTGDAVVVVWSENQGGNWDLCRGRYDVATKTWSDPKRLTESPGADADVALATAPDGQVWMAWQSWGPHTGPGDLPPESQADIFLAPVEDASSSIRVTDTAANEWTPALAIDRGGNLHVAYDSYRAGNYDVSLYTHFAKGSSPDRTMPIASTPRFEARPSLTIDPRGRAWVAYEERTANWGKDAENLVDGKGSTLYRSASVRVRCVDGDRVLDAPDPLAQAPESIRMRNSYPRLIVDRSGRPWLAFRHRQEAVWGNNAVMVVGGVWLEYATSLAGDAWSVPQVLPRSDGLLDNRPALVATADGPVLAFYSTDGRLRREVEFSPELARRYWAQSGTPGSPDGVFNEDLQVASLAPSSGQGGAAEPALTQPPAERAEPPAPPVHADEEADVARMRNHRIQAGGKTYRLLRGDFHRHTEISQDGGSDGSLEDMWRYALDAARFDWMGDNDHDNGGAKEYTWWLVQKTTDLYHQPPSFVTLFSYERSVAYPGGHRNVMFDRRGVRTLPRLVNAAGQVSDDDTKMLYDYLKELGGICASHTSATGMGTDWRDNDPKAEPIVEIYQGHRNSYEHLGAPRVARRPGEAIGGWRPLGMVWNALAMQYRLGFQASSDHISTHISYGVALAEDRSRAGVLDAFRRRHCYGATDNIVLDVRSGDHLMGDEFDADGPVRLKVLAHGTAPIARIDVIKDFVYVYSTEPHRARVEFSWTDEERRPPGLSWYYVRVLQEDGEIAWGSPLWVHHRSASPVR
jgi:hypothetical protein